MTTTTSSYVVPYVNLAAQHAALRHELLAAVGRVLDHAQFILGDEVLAFENAFADLCGTGYAVGVNSGTDALILALRALSIGRGDEVITAPNSFVATASAIELVGARPVFVDVDDDMNIDARQIESAITPNTKAIIVVHLTGRAADMSAILPIAKRYGLRVIEDAAQSVLAKHASQRVGSFGDAGCFSFHPLKTLGACGDAGIVTTNDVEISNRVKTLRNIGLLGRDDAVAWSGNSRLDALQAAILQVKLRYVQAWTDRRREHAQYYRSQLADCVLVPTEGTRDYAVYHTFVIRAERRDELKDQLKREGVETSIHYPKPIHLTTVGRSLGYREGDFPQAERQARTILSLPVYPELTHAQRESVVGSIRRFYGIGGTN